MFFLSTSHQALFWRIRHLLSLLLLFHILCVWVFSKWFPLSLSVALLLHTSLQSYWFTHFIIIWSVLTRCMLLFSLLFWLCLVDFARPAGLTSFALSLSLFALFCSVFWFCNLLVLRMSSRFQYEYTFKSCTCFLCYRPKRDDVFAHFCFVCFTINHYFVVF